MLSNGDIIAFGKTVGKDHSWCILLELWFGSQSEVASGTSANTRSPVAVLPVDARAGRTRSGRYGLYIPSLSPDGSSG